MRVYSMLKHNALLGVICPHSMELHSQML